MGLVHLTDKNFEEEVSKSSIPVMVDFWAEWCGPCKMISPIIDEVANKYSGKLKVGKVNVDDAQQLAMQFSIMSIPTIIFFKDGKPVDQIIGVASKDQLVDKVSQNL